jgi:uncharacterized protein (TIGR02246 family)
MTDLDALSQWIEGYVRAWNSNDPEDIGRLFTDDASYATAPYDPPWRGREQIVQRWLKIKDEPGETSFEWEPISLTDDVAVISGTSRYPEVTYGNVWVIKLARDGRCREFAEWWMEYPRP